jgi:putative membrane protein
MKRFLVAAAALLGLAVVSLPLLGGAPAAAAPAEDGPAPAPFVMPSNASTTKLTSADRMFLEKVRQAGLWEIPSGQMAIQKGTTDRVKEVGRLIAIDHGVLDDDVRRVATFLSVPLPDEATPEQQLWLREQREATGEKFDAVFAQRLRFAHGAVYSAIAQVRASSRSELMRAFAKHCEIFVHRHMELLESTGDVDFDALPLPVVAKGNLRQAEEKQPLMLIALFAVTGALGVAGVARALRGAA